MIGPAIMVLITIPVCVVGVGSVIYFEDRIVRYCIAAMKARAGKV